MKKYLVILLILTAAAPLFSQSIEISQIDTNRMLLKGDIDIYFRAAGNPAVEDFTVKESSLGELEIKSFSTTPNKDSGIDYLLLLDNSGSMYDESYQGSKRITQAKLAINSFIDQIDESKDRTAVYAFNTGLEKIADFNSAPAEIRRNLASLKQPASEQAYTELYNSLTEITSLFPKDGGRRAVIVLSDGENFSIYEKIGKVHPVWGTDTATPEEVISAFQKTGLSLDGINISDSRDASLEQICSEAGGHFHDVRSTDELRAVYADIREKILSEYRLTVAAPPFRANTGEIIVEYNGSSDSGVVLIPLLFGGAADGQLVVTLIILFAGLAGLAVLYLISFEKPVKEAQLQALGAGQKTILNEGATIIGASKEADYTIAGNPGIDARHATILHDEATDVYTLVSDKAVHVNNRKVKTRKLRPGDVIRIEGSTVIFDKPEKK